MMVQYIIKMGIRTWAEKWESWQYIGPFETQQKAIDYYHDRYPHAQTNPPDWVVEELTVPGK